ncbi:MAG: thioredoxin family protein [Sulfurospirillum cavolei]|nr:thioredoxin family protein [Sulfurospirillum cavolei]
MQALNEIELLERLSQPHRAFLLLLHTAHCSQCKIADARVKRVEQNPVLHVDFLTCNLDEAPRIHELFNIRSVPVCMAYNEKSELHRVEYGLKSEAVYESMALGVNTQKGNPKSRLLGF